MTDNDLSNWMSNLPNGLALSRITIPGTHDSSTFLPNVLDLSGYVQTQTLDFSDQLAAGCRFLDIRCLINSSGSLNLCHGPVDLKVNLQAAIDSCTQFLKTNPQECVLMSISKDKSADTTADFLAAIGPYLTDNQDVFYQESSIPELGAVRGKIVLLRRYDNSSGGPGINCPFETNTAFSSSINSYQMLYGEDLYNPTSVSDKESAIQNNLVRALYNQDSDNLYITFTSGYINNLIPPYLQNPSDLAGKINPWLADFLTNLPVNNPLGILAMDFVENVSVPQLLSFDNSNPPSTVLKQVEGSSSSYFPGDNVGSESTYVDSDELVAPAGQVALGFQLSLGGNRIFPNLLFGGMDGSNQSWTTAPSSDENYFPKGGASGIGDTGSDTMYIDSNLVMAPEGQVVIGVGFYEKGNRVALQLYCGTPSKQFSDAAWVQNDNSSSVSGYFVGGSNLSSFYVEDNSITCDPGYVVVGIGLMQGGENWTYANRISYQILTAPAAAF